MLSARSNFPYWLVLLSQDHLAWRSALLLACHDWGDTWQNERFSGEKNDAWQIETVNQAHNNNIKNKTFQTLQGSADVHPGTFFFSSFFPSLSPQTEIVCQQQIIYHKKLLDPSGVEMTRHIIEAIMPWMRRTFCIVSEEDLLFCGEDLVCMSISSWPDLVCKSSKLFSNSDIFEGHLEKSKCKKNNMWIFYPTDLETEF